MKDTSAEVDTDPGQIKPKSYPCGVLEKRKEFGNRCHEFFRGLGGGGDRVGNRALRPPIRRYFFGETWSAGNAVLRGTTVKSQPRLTIEKANEEEGNAQVITVAVYLSPLHFSLFFRNKEVEIVTVTIHPPFPLFFPTSLSFAFFAHRRGITIVARFY